MRTDGPLDEKAHYESQLDSSTEILSGRLGSVLLGKALDWWVYIFFLPMFLLCTLGSLWMTILSLTTPRF